MTGAPERRVGVTGRAIPGRIGVVTVASATATFVVLAAGWMVSSDLGAAELVTGEHLAMTALWVLVPLALAIAAFGSSTSIRLTLVVAAVVVAATPLVVGPRTGFAYLLLAFGAVAAASLALPVRLSSVMLFSFVGVLCLVPLGYYVLPVLVAFLSLVCTARSDEPSDHQCGQGIRVTPTNGRMEVWQVAGRHYTAAAPADISAGARLHLGSISTSSRVRRYTKSTESQSCATEAKRSRGVMN